MIDRIKIESLLFLLTKVESEYKKGSDSIEYTIASRRVSTSLTNSFKNSLIEQLYEVGMIESFDWPCWEEGLTFIKSEEKDYASRELGFLQKLLTLHIRKDRFFDGWFEQRVVDSSIFQILTAIKEKV